MSETDLVRACLELLHLKGVPAWRNNSGGTKIGKRFIRFGMKGSSDIIGVLPPDGRLLAVECKVGRNRVSPSQKMFIDAVNEAGGVGVVIRGVDELDEMLPEPISVSGRG